MGPQVSLLPDGKRLHLHHGPIDLIVEAYGDAHEVRQSYAQAQRAFETVLEGLAEEILFLRTCDAVAHKRVAGPVARRMCRAIKPHSKTFVTPMAAVAGSVADHMLAELTKGRDLTRAYVNNGGDCALYLNEGQSLKMAAIAHGEFGTLEINHQDPVRGVATSGWRGRSHSLGIADAATVVAKDAASADVAATLIANAVDLPDHPAVIRKPANRLNPDSDLGSRLVTTHVGALNQRDIETALNKGLSTAQKMKERGLIEDALLFLADQTQQTTAQRKRTYA